MTWRTTDCYLQFQTTAALLVLKWYHSTGTVLVVLLVVVVAVVVAVAVGSKKSDMTDNGLLLLAVSEHRSTEVHMPRQQRGSNSAATRQQGITTRYTVKVYQTAVTQRPLLLCCVHPSWRLIGTSCAVGSPSLRMIGTFSCVICAPPGA